MHSGSVLLRFTTTSDFLILAGVLLDSAMDVAGRQAGGKRKRAAAVVAAIASPPVSTKKSAAAGIIRHLQFYSLSRQLHEASTRCCAASSWMGQPLGICMIDSRWLLSLCNSVLNYCN